MEDYDPLNAPDPDEWQSMDEDERITLVMEHHRESGVELPNEQTHAAIHVIVENQIALGDEVPTEATVECLIWTVSSAVRLESLRYLTIPPGVPHIVHGMAVGFVTLAC